MPIIMLPPIMPLPIMPSVVPPGSRVPIIPPCIMAPMPTMPITASAVQSTASELNTQSAVRSPFSMIVSLQRPAAHASTQVGLPTDRCHLDGVGDSMQRQCTRDRGRHTDAGVPERSDTTQDLTVAHGQGDSCGLVYFLVDMSNFHAIYPGCHDLPPA